MTKLSIRPIPSARSSALILVALIGVALLIGHRRSYHSTPNRSLSAKDLISPTTTPISIEPVADLRDAIDQQSVHEVIIRTIPRWTAFKYSRALHALRLWGASADFDSYTPPAPAPDMHIYSGAELTSLFLNHDFLLKAIENAEPILYDTPHGIGVFDHSRRSGFEGHVGHVDCLLCACAEIGLPANTNVWSSSKHGTLADVIAESVASFDPDQETEWTLEAFVRYLAPQQQITNRFGDTYSFSAMLNKLLDRPIGRGTCYGTHVPYCVIAVLRVNEVEPFLDRKTVRRAEQYLKRVANLLEKCQNEDGSWPSRWASGVLPDPAEADSRLKFWQSEAARSMYTTAHHLEWVALAPAHLRPSRRAITTAASYFCREMQRLPIETLMYNYLPLSHGARALCLMKNVTPMDVLRSKPASAP